jgi:hypothetical protein
MPRLHSPLWPDHRIKPPYGSVEVDWGHPLANGLVGYWLLNERAGRGVVNLATLQVGSGTWTNLVWAESSFNSVIRGTGAAAEDFIATGLVLPWTSLRGLTMSCRASISGTGRWNMIMACGSGSLLGYLAKNTINKLECVLSGPAGSGYNQRYSIDTLGAGCATYGFRWRAGEQVDVFVNGVNSPGNTAGDLQSTLLHCSQFQLMGWFANNSYAVQGEINNASIWSRALSDVEMLQLSADPYCFLREVKKRSYGFVGAGAGGEVTWWPWATDRKTPRGIGRGICRGM